jgi:hypothetical protein
LLPLLLICLATGAAATIAYGTHPGWADDSVNGLRMIMLARRAEWPLVAFSLLNCLALLGLVISSRRRAWWLIGLAPVLALFIHRYAPSGRQQIWVLESPQFLAAHEQPNLLADDTWIVGVVFAGQAYALPYWALYTTPVVFITDYDKRMIVMWSARANRAVAYTIARELKARDLEIVTTPADTLLIYDRRLGQFIVALTGEVPGGGKPVGLLQPIETVKTTWNNWAKLHPQTSVLRGYRMSPDAPSSPILPRLSGRLIDGMSAEARIAMIGTAPPVAIPAEPTDQALLHRRAGARRLLILRDPHTGRLRAFDRNVNQDMFPSFEPATIDRLPMAVMTDSDSKSWWTADGKAIDGPLKGAQMTELPAEEDLYWGVIKYWYPELTLAE